MKFLRVVRNRFESIGLCPELDPFNHQILVTFATDILLNFLIWVFLLHEADSSQEYMESIERNFEKLV